MGFWTRGKRSREEDEALAAAAPAAQPATHLSVVEFWTAEQRFTVGMDLSGERLVDLLNRELSVRVAMLDEVPDNASKPIEILPGMRWADFAVDEALLAFPPPQVTDPMRRLHRPRQPVEIAIGPFQVSGSAHIPPGAQAAGFAMRQNARFMAITRAVISDAQLEGFEQRAGVLLVNLRWIETIRDVGLGEREVPEAPDGGAAAV